jgi:hypothetical protein
MSHQLPSNRFAPTFRWALLDLCEFGLGDAAFIARCEAATRQFNSDPQGGTPGVTGTSSKSVMLIGIAATDIGSFN